MGVRNKEEGWPRLVIYYRVECLLPQSQSAARAPGIPLQVQWVPKEKKSSKSYRGRRIPSGMGSLSHLEKDLNISKRTCSYIGWLDRVVAFHLLRTHGHEGGLAS